MRRIIVLNYASLDGFIAKENEKNNDWIVWDDGIDDYYETNEAQIRAIIYERVEGVKNKDVNALIINHAPDIKAFDLLDPLRYEGVETVKERAENRLSA